MTEENLDPAYHEAEAARLLRVLDQKDGSWVTLATRAHAHATLAQSLRLGQIMGVTIYDGMLRIGVTQG